MARSFNGSTDGYSSSDARFNLTGTITVAAAVSYTASGRVFSHWGLIPSLQQWLLEIDASGHAQFARQDGSGLVYQVSTGATVLDTGKYYRVMGRSDGTVGGDVLVNGVADGSDATTLTAVSTTHNTSIGMEPDVSTFIAAALGELAVWDVRLNNDEAIAYANGTSPLLIRPQSLIEYIPLIGRFSTEIGVKGTTWTASGTPSAAAHPRTFAPAHMLLPRKPAVAATGAGPLVDSLRLKSLVGGALAA